MVFVYLCFLIILLISLFASYIIYKHNFIRQIQLSGKLPGPPALPIIGNGLLFLNKSAVGR